MCAAQKTPKQLADEITVEGELMKIPTRAASVEVLRRIRTEMENNKAYRMQSKCRGRAIIIINTQFTGGRQFDPLPAVEHDEQNLKRLFTELQFQTVLWKNKTLETVKTLLREEQTNATHQSADALVVCVSSHGTNGAFLTHDSQPTDIEVLTTYFDGMNCNGLIGKPKLFFIDACQGAKSTSGVRPSSAKGAQSSDDCRRYHEKEDTYVCRATVADYTARLEKVGSRFIRCLVYIVSRKAHRKHLESMMREINAIMPCFDADEMQVPWLSSNLRKKCYLIPRFDKMQIFVLHQKNTQFYVYASDTVAGLYATVSEELNVPLDELDLYHQGEISLLRERMGYTLKECGIVNGSTLQLVYRGSGGLTDLQTRVREKARRTRADRRSRERFPRQNAQVSATSSHQIEIGDTTWFTITLTDSAVFKKVAENT